MRGVEALETAFARYLPQLVVAVVRGLPTLRAFNRVEEQAHLDRCWLSVPDKRRLRDQTISGEEAA